MYSWKLFWKLHPHSMKDTGRKFQWSLQRKDYRTFREAYWNFQNGYIGSFLCKLPERFLEGTRGSSKYLTMKYFMKALCKLLKSLHEILQKIITGNIHEKFLEDNKKPLERRKVPFHVKLTRSFCNIFYKASSGTSVWIFKGSFHEKF